MDSQIFLHLGIVLDSYFSVTPEISKYIEDNDCKISETVEVKSRSYGMLVRDLDLTECLRDQVYDEDFTDIITEEIESEVHANCYLYSGNTGWLTD